MKIIVPFSEKRLSFAGALAVICTLVFFALPGWATDPSKAEKRAETIKPGTAGVVGCGSNPKRVRRLVIDKPGVYENYLVDGEWAGSTLVKINADNVTLKNCEIRNGTHNAVTVYAKNVLIDSCKIHHVLAGTFKDQHDAHGITGRPQKLIIRNCDIGLTSGDSIQFDPGRGPWGDVLVEHCTLWTAPLPSDAAGFRKGERPGENAIDTKQQTSNPRSRLTVRACLMHGWNQPGQIGNMAALNLKNHVDVTVEHCLFRDNEICFRIRGGKGERGGAHVTIHQCAVYDSQFALRIEEEPEKLSIRRFGVGPGIKRTLRVVGGGDESDYKDLDQYAPPAYEAVLKSGFGQ